MELFRSFANESDWITLYIVFFPKKKNIWGSKRWRMIPEKDIDRDFDIVWACVCKCTYTKQMQPRCLANETKVRLKPSLVFLQLRCCNVALWIRRHLLGMTDFICCHLPAVAKFPATCVPPRPQNCTQTLSYLGHNAPSFFVSMQKILPGYIPIILCCNEYTWYLWKHHRNQAQVKLKNSGVRHALDTWPKMLKLWRGLLVFPLSLLKHLPPWRTPALMTGRWEKPGPMGQTRSWNTRSAKTKQPESRRNTLLKKRVI